LKLPEFCDKTLLSRFFLMKGLDDGRCPVTACDELHKVLEACFEESQFPSDG
jgi:hypothetical protein